MATHRLPVPGSDNGTWGDVLNDFLIQSHNADGTLLDGLITDAKVSSSAAISKSKLAPGVQASLTAADTGVQTVNGKSPTSGAVNLVAGDVGAPPKPLSSVDGKAVKWNDATGQLEDATTTLNATFAPLASPAFTGTPTINGAAIGAAISAALSPAPLGGNAAFTVYPNASGSLSNGTDTGGNTKSDLTTVPIAVKRLGAMWNNSYNLAGVEADGVNALSFRAAVEYPASTFTPIYFGGKRDVTIDPGATIESDWCDVQIPAAATAWIRTYWTVASAGMKVPSYAVGIGQSGTAQTDLTTLGSISSGGAVYGPVRVQADRQAPSLPRIFVMGDSRVLGAGDSTGTGSRGWVSRAFDGVSCYSRYGISSGKMQAHAAIVTTRRGWAVAQGCNIGILADGINDVISGASLASIQGYAVAIGNEMLARGMKPWLTTLEPNSTSTDFFTTVANQTAAATESVRVAYNNWVRTTPSPFVGFVELADAVESARDSGKWKASGRTVTDAAVTSGSGVVTSATGNFTIADSGRIVAIAGAGASGATLLAFISSTGLSSTPTNQFTMTSKLASTTVSGATMNIGINESTSDGLHGAARGETLAAAAVPISSLLP